MGKYISVIEAASNLAEILPSTTAEAVASILISGKNNINAEITSQVPHHHHRDLALGFVERWKSEFAEFDAENVGLVLRTAVFAERKRRDSLSVELVWTGPDVGTKHFRRTEQAILQLIDAARERITLVSFAVYRIPNIANALVRAANRGVNLTVIVETPDKLGGENEYSTIRALGHKVEECSSVYYWPKENRKVGENEKVGILHTKCAVADRDWLFISSANLTQQAFTINMELGLMVRGGSIPTQVEQQYQIMIESGELRRL